MLEKLKKHYKYIIGIILVLLYIIPMDYTVPIITYLSLLYIVYLFKQK